jgi:hypothetical protein
MCLRNQRQGPAVDAAGDTGAHRGEARGVERSRGGGGGADGAGGNGGANQVGGGGGVLPAPRHGPRARAVPQAVEHVRMGSAVPLSKLVLCVNIVATAYHLQGRAAPIDYNHHITFYL